MHHPSDGKFLKYAYLNASYLPYAQVRIGQYKAFFSREYLTSFADVDTIKRAMITDSGGINPKYDIGSRSGAPRSLTACSGTGSGYSMATEPTIPIRMMTRM